jgi:WD40 repeat protein
VVFSPDGTRIVTTYYSGSASVWDATTGKKITDFWPFDRTWITVFSPDGTRIVTASRWTDDFDFTARLFDANTGEEIATLRGHEDNVRSAVFSRDGERIVTASDDHTARLWDAETGQEIVVLRGHEGDVNGAAFAADGARIITASDDRTMRLWDAETGHEITCVTIEANATALAVKGVDVAVGDRIGRLHVFSTA